MFCVRRRPPGRGVSVSHSGGSLPLAGQPDVPGRRIRAERRIHPRRFHNPNGSSKAPLRRAHLRRARRSGTFTARQQSAATYRCSVVPRKSFRRPRVHREQHQALQPQSFSDKTLVQSSCTRNAGLCEERGQEPLQAPARNQRKWPRSRRTPRGPRRSTRPSSSARRSSAR